MAAALTALALAGPAYAQTSGNLDGVVSDPDGLGVPGATVTLQSPQLIGGMQEQTTNEDGYYRFIQLLPGIYQLTIVKGGFNSVSVQGIQVIANHDVTQNVVLELGAGGEEIEIVASQAIDTTSTTVGQVLTKDFLQRIPTGRSYQQAVQVATGVTGGSNPNMGGSGSNENAYMLDGANVTDPVTGTFGTNFNYDAIQQLEVLLGGYDAEFNTIGGIINIVTESGSNNLDFDTSVFYDNADWRPRKDARYTSDGNPLAPTGFDSTFQILQINSLVSGPLVRDKAYFLFSYSHERSLIALTGIPQRRDYSGHYILAKLTVQPNASHRVTLQMQTSPAAIDNISQGNPFQKPEAQGQQAQSGFVAQARWQWFLNEKVNIDTRVQTQKITINQNAVPCTHDQTADRHHCKPGEEENDIDYFTPGRVGQFGAYDSVNWGTIYFDDRWRITAGTKVSLVGIRDPFKGSHDFKFGVEGNQFINNFLNGYSGSTQYYDINEAPFNPDTFTNYFWIETTGPVFQRNTGSVWNVFAQDVYKPVSNLTMRYGFRIDNTLLRNDIGDPVVRATAFSPRFYAAWDPTNDQKTKIAGGYGRFVDTGRQEVAGFTSGGSFGYKLYLGEFFGGGVSQVSNADDMADSSPSDNLNTANENLRLPTLDEFVFLFQRQIVTDFTVGAQATARLSRHLFEPDDQNIVWDEDGSAVIGSRRLDPFNYYLRLRTPREARRNYYRVDLYLAKVFTRRWGGRVTYSYEFENGTSEESLVGAFVNDPQTRYHYGPLQTVRTHSMNAYGFWDLPNDPWTTTLGFFVNYESGAPLERAYWGDQGISSGGYSQRVRDRYFYWKFNDIWSLSLQIEQKFDVRKGQLSIQAALLNLTNNQAPENYYGYGVYQLNRLFTFSRQDPLRLQLGVTYQF